MALIEEYNFNTILRRDLAVWIWTKLNKIWNVQYSMRKYREPRDYDMSLGNFFVDHVNKIGSISEEILSCILAIHVHEFET